MPELQGNQDETRLLKSGIIIRKKLRSEAEETKVLSSSQKKKRPQEEEPTELFHKNSFETRSEQETKEASKKVSVFDRLIKKDKSSSGPKN